MSESLPLPVAVLETPDPERWRGIAGLDLQDVIYHHEAERTREADGIVVTCTGLLVVRITSSRLGLRNTFRSETIDSLYRILNCAKPDPSVGVVVLTDNSSPPEDGGWAFCLGGDQCVRGRDGYRCEGVTSGKARSSAETSSAGRASGGRPSGGCPSNGRLYILEVQRLIRSMPKVVIAAISGWAAGDGHSLHVVCDLSVALLEHARFKQTGANVGPFDVGYGSQLFTRQAGDRRAQETLFLTQPYPAENIVTWGAANETVPRAELEDRTLECVAAVVQKSPQVIRMLKFVFNVADNGIAGMQAFASETTRFAYMIGEARKGRDTLPE